MGSSSPRTHWGKQESSLMVNVSPSRAKSTSLHGLKVNRGSRQPHAAVRTLPQHELFDLSSEHVRAIAPYRVSSAGNLQSQAGDLGGGQGGGVLHAESFPDKLFPYYTWQPPTDRLPEGSRKAYEVPLSLTSLHPSISLLSRETLQLAAPPERVRGVASTPAAQGARGRARCTSLPARQLPPRSLRGAAVLPALCRQISASGEPGGRAALRACEAIALARCRTCLRVRRASSYHVYLHPGLAGCKPGATELFLQRASKRS